MQHRLTPILGTACGVVLAAVPLQALAGPAPQPAAAAAAIAVGALAPAAAPGDVPAKPPAQWPLTALKSDQIWKITKGAGATVALIDSGVSPLGDTKTNLLPGADFSSGPTSTGVAHIDTDVDSHGTGMAALIAGSGGGLGLMGLAPEAKILPIRMQKATGEDPVKITNSIKYALTQHVKVINMSLGTSQTPELAAAVKAAQDADIVVVAAAGNGGGKVIIPAAYPGVVAAAAVDKSNVRWSMSAVGPQVVLAAPGVAIPVENAVGVLKTDNGTSNSTAYITASVALVRALHPDWTAGQTIRALLATATKAGGATGLGRNDQYGYGIVNPLAALQAGAPVEKDNPLIIGAAPLAAALPANAPAAAPTPGPSSSGSASGSPSAAATPGAPTSAAASSSGQPVPVADSSTSNGLLGTKRKKLFAVAGGGILLGCLLFALNGVLKRRAARKNRAWH